ncbi:MULTISPECIES: PE family protein [Mycobacterium]|uniref:PE family protein n=1 Tax=Mycobacterium TaxID=1763 RepID=UPI001EF09D0A|nr:MULTISPECIES: PE family protein [Mycobacterium]GLC16858.1 hypothetical protein SRL2020448_54610 [Mycobacterium kiyosense]GLD15489.1 hypothetical protein Mkiyose1384_57220 [Mycobacterium kiyosense]
MSLVIDPGLVATATGQLADIGASIGETAAAASAPTTQIAVAASDEVSAAVARLFGTLGAEFQQANAQAAAFHAEFVRVLSTSAAAYIGAEIANAEKQLLDTSAAAAATDPLGGLLGSILGGGTSTSGTGLGGLLGGSGGLLDPILFGGTGGLLGPLIGGNGVLTSLVGNGPFGSILNSAGQQFGAGISALIGGTGGQFLTGQLQGLGSLLFPGLFPTTGVVTTAPAVGGAWQQLFINTGNNLAALNAAFAADPFPLLRQIVANQQGYAMQIGAELAYVAQHPALVGQASLAYLMSGGPALAVQTAVNGTLSGTAGNWQTLSTSFSAFNRDLSANLAHFPSDWAKVNQDLATGQYHLAVTDGTSAVLNVFLSGFDTHNLADIKLVGPVGDLFPVISLPGQNLSGLSTLMPAHSVPAQMTNNLGRFFTALADTSVSTTISGTVNPPALVLGANFGLPLSLLFGVAGAPVAGLNGLATAGTVIGGGIATGNPVQVAGGLVDAPAYVLNGLLNGEAIVDVPLPVTFDVPILSTLTGPINIPVVAHLPFNGLLVPPHAITATVPISVLGISIPINLTLGGTKFGGLFQLLANTGFRTLADSIAN